VVWVRSGLHERGVTGCSQVTATVDVRRSRHAFQETGKYVPIITDGGMSKGGDVQRLRLGRRGNGGQRVCPRAGSARPGTIGAWPHPTQTSARHTHQGRHHRVAQADPFGPATVDDGSQTSWAHHDLHGQCGRGDHPPVSRDRNYHRPASSGGKLFQTVQSGDGDEVRKLLNPDSSE
jgi:IMP dehydrogenase